jgi:hypothetical protein
MFDGLASTRTDADLDRSQASMTEVESLLRYHLPPIGRATSPAAKARVQSPNGGASAGMRSAHEL